MREIKARFTSVCPETGWTIKAGDTCIYDPRGRKAYHTSSKTADAYRQDQFNRQWCMADANY